MKQYGGRPPKGIVAAALVVLERLRTDCQLSLSAHVAKGGAQIAGLTPSALKRVLERFGEHRRFLGEAGRTNRGNNAPIKDLLESLDAAGFASLSSDQRAQHIDAMQEFLVQSASDYYNLEHIQFAFDASRPIRGIIAAILASAAARNQAGAVAQHLVGAKLAIRFDGLEVSNFPYSAADDQAGRAGDFQVGGTAFHITVSPTPGHVQKCADNLRQGLWAYFLVPDSELERTRFRVEDSEARGRVAVESIETFVGQNISELALFEPGRSAGTLKDLLDEYNRRVHEVENDRSLLIDLPAAIAENDNRT